MNSDWTTTNPCNEIPIGTPQFVMPWVQVQMMQYLRKRSGQPLMTLQECQETEQLLQQQIDEMECKPEHTIIRT
jgi:hypothetical protein